MFSKATSLERGLGHFVHGHLTQATKRRLVNHEFPIDMKMPEIPGGRLMRLEHFLQRSGVLDPTGAGLAARI